MNPLKVVELFETVQGEGIYIGVPSVFFRTGRCNLRCPGCDTKWDQWTPTDVQTCADKINNYASKHVVFTGGEPTIWQKELSELARRLPAFLTITVESNGSIPIRNQYLLERVNLWSFSPKVGSLGHDEYFKHDVVLENIAATQGKNQLKYVLDPNVPKHIDSVFDFHAKVDMYCPKDVKDDFDERIGTQLVPDDRVFFQPYDRGTAVNIYARQVAFNVNEEYNRDLALLTKVVLERSASRFRVVPQLHKYISYR